MKKLIGFLILIGILAGAGLLVKHWLQPTLANKQVLDTTDAKDARPFRVGGDGYVGYWFLKAPDFKRKATSVGIRVTLENDEGAYADRLAKFAKRELEAIVLPVSSYLEHGQKHGFPGAIVAVLAESVGADGIVAFKDKVPNGKVQDLNNPALVWTMVGDSPSEFLTSVTTTDIDLSSLTSSTSWKRTVGSMKEVNQAIKNRQGDVFVLWEPDQSRALKNNRDLVYVWGSDKFRGYIVDVLVVHSDVIKNRPDDVRKILEAYFLVQRTYALDEKRLIADMKSSEGLTEEEVKTMLSRVDFFDLEENARKMFGISDANNSNATEGVINTILACSNVLVRSGKLKGDPTNGDPYRLTNRRFIEGLAKSLPAALGKIAMTEFSALDDAGWRKLPEVVSLRVDPITFKAGESLLDDNGKEIVMKVAELLKNNYLSYRVIVRGHTDQMESEEESIALSKERAEAVLKYLTLVGGIAPDRLRAEGMGSIQPPTRLPGESDRVFARRRARVGIVFVEGGKI